MTHKKTHLFFRFTLLTIFVIHFAHIRTEIECNIVFPNNYKSQGLKIYQGGRIIHTTMNDASLISFFVDDHSKNHQLNLLVIRPSDIRYTFKHAISKIKQQTIDCINVAPQCEYKFYKLSQKKNQGWVVSEIRLDNDMIPDTTVLIFYNPAYVDTLTISENHIPTFVIADNLLQIARGKELLFTEELIYLLDTLHMDPLHQKSSYRVVTSNPKCKQVIRT